MYLIYLLLIFRIHTSINHCTVSERNDTSCKPLKVYLLPRYKHSAYFLALLLLSIEIRTNVNICLQQVKIQF